MDKIIMIMQLLAGLSLLVIVHEFGHFIAARAFGMRVEKFYLFFDAYGKKLFSFKRGDTEYGLGWLPLGGYVKISGMIDESMDKDQLAEEPKPWEFRSKPAWQRLIVMLGGIILNVILGYIIFTGKIGYFGETKQLNSYAINHSGMQANKLGEALGFKDGDKVLKMNGEPLIYFKDLLLKDALNSDDNVATLIRDGKEIEVRLPDNVMGIMTDMGKGDFVSVRYKFTVDSVMPRSGAEEAGLQRGDIIKMVNDEKIEYFNDLPPILFKHKTREINLTYLRDTQLITSKTTVSPEGTLGFGVAVEDADQIDTTLKYSGSAIFSAGLKASKETLVQQAIGIKKLITGKLNFMKSVSSPVGIAKVYGGQFSWQNFWRITGLLSFVLAIMNLLPIPALDGGHVVFLLVEMVRGKPLSDKAMMRAQVVGFVIIMSIMLIAVFSDIFIK